MRSQFTLVRSAQAVRVMASRLIRARRFIGYLQIVGVFLIGHFPYKVVYLY
jgi:hypothetical protein